MRYLTISLFITLLGVLCSNAQILTSTPTPLQEDSENVEIYFHANMGNQGLANLPASTQIYAHTGVEVLCNGKLTSWKYAPTWGANLPKYKLEYVSDNLWKLYIGNMREYYGVAENETIKRLCFVFRTADCKKEGKGPGNSDIFLNVEDAGLQISFTHNATSNLVNAETGPVSFTLAATEPANLEILVNGTILKSAENAKKLTADYTFEKIGNYIVEANATANGQTISRTLNFAYLEKSKPATQSTLPPLGCTENPDGSFTFCMAAPEKTTAAIVGSWNDFTISNDYVMNYTDQPIEAELDENNTIIADAATARFFTLTIAGDKIQTPFSYYYLIDGKNVSDPYANLILDPQNDKYISREVFPNLPAYPTQLESINVPLAYVDPTLFNYDWQERNFEIPDKEHLVIYELLLRDFTGTEGQADGNGNLALAMQKLDYLKQLGVNVIELLPINEFNGNNSWGYNPNFYFAPDKAYGTPKQYKEFIDACHQRGMAVVLDMVYNQTDWLHPWFQLYEIGENPFYNPDAPHAYSVLNDWNQGHPLVLRQERDCVKYWIQEYKVDGFRFDLVKGLGLNNSYSNNGSQATDAYNASRVARMKAIHQAVNEVNPKALFINENLAGAKEENEMAADDELNWANYNNQGGQYAMGYQTDADLQGFWAAKSSRTPGSTVSYLESHDEERLAYKQITYGDASLVSNHEACMQRLGSTAAQMILTPGAHMIWMFSEMGNAQTTKNSSGNDTSPKKVDWNLLGNKYNAGLKISYQELINIRLGYPELFDSNASTNINDLPYFNNFATGWERGRIIQARTENKELYCAINPNLNSELTVVLPLRSTDSSNYTIASKSFGSNPEFSASASTVKLQPNCYAVIATKGISGVDNPQSDNCDLRIFSEGNTLIVENATGLVEIYNMSGQKVSEKNANNSCSFNLTSGLYIIRNQGESIKFHIQ